MWGAFNTIKHALLTEDEALLQTAVERISEEITVGMKEGIQEDYSFFQHGPRLYSGGYGRSFLYDVSTVLFLLQGTRYRLSEEKTEIVLSYLLDGVRPMVQGHSLDWSCVGREIARADALDVGYVRTSLEILSRTADLPRKQEIRAFLESVQGGAQFNGTKYFDKAFMLCHHFNGIYVGAKFLNDKLFGAEICNGEGELCYNMSYGTQTCIMRNGDEYFNVDPVWDFSRIPGTTALIETDEQLLAHRDWMTKPLPNEHFGGKQQGRRAVIYELAEHGGIQMQVADFAFEDGFVCLGAEQALSGVDRAGLVTTVDQCLVQGEVAVEDGSVVHNAIRYTALQDTRIQAAVETKRGSWHRNNTAQPDEPVSAKVLTLSIDHFENGKCQYAYLISSADAPVPKVEVLRNDCAVQAIRLPDGQVMAVFHQPEVLSVDGETMTGDAGTILC
jgi:chondroitin AC lyase